MYVVGIGPGAYEHMTVKAAKVLGECEVVVGYTVYAELLRKYFPDKEYLTTPMRQEELRCRMAFEEAKKGKKVSMVCSGDSGIYGMAGLMLELGKEYPDIEVEVVPGVTAALGGAALLGAPLGHDVCFVSLSDLMTPWDVIEKRLVSAAEGDFVLCLYNPSSRKRKDYLAKACEILLRHKERETVCGIVHNIARSGEEMEVMTLGELKSARADMFSTVFVGNSETRVVNGKMVTPRGYQAEKEPVR